VTVPRALRFDGGPVFTSELGFRWTRIGFILICFAEPSSGRLRRAANLVRVNRPRLSSQVSSIRRNAAVCAASGCSDSLVRDRRERERFQPPTPSPVRSRLSGALSLATKWLANLFGSGDRRNGLQIPSAPWRIAQENELALSIESAEVRMAVEGGAESLEVGHRAGLTARDAEASKLSRNVT
jgi:hypothetical protein